MVSQKEKEQIVQLYFIGNISQLEISKKLGLKYQAVNYVCNEYMGKQIKKENTEEEKSEAVKNYFFSDLEKAAHEYNKSKEPKTDLTIGEVWVDKSNRMRLKQNDKLVTV